MSNIVFVNLDVGSAIEQSGEQFIEWIREVTEDITVFREQGQEFRFYNFLVENSPSIVIVNSFYPRILTPLYYYKLAHPDLKIILISRVFTDFFLEKDTTDLHGFYYEDRLEQLCRLANYIFIINSCGIKERIPGWISDKAVDCCGTNDENKFYIQTPWSQREKKFVILGSLNSHKLSPDFLDKIQNTDIVIDAYGPTRNQPDQFAEKFHKCPNIKYQGELEFNEVPAILNEYKYYLLPHNGYEPLCNSLHQAILCGCIPIVLEDNAKGPDGHYWLEFARGMYFGCESIEEYIRAIQALWEEDFKEGDKLAEINRKKYIEKYSKQPLTIKDIVRDWLK